MKLISTLLAFSMFTSTAFADNGENGRLIGGIIGGLIGGAIAGGAPPPSWGGRPGWPAPPWPGRRGPGHGRPGPGPGSGPNVDLCNGAFGDGRGSFLQLSERGNNYIQVVYTSNGATYYGQGQCWQTGYDSAQFNFSLQFNG